LILSHIQSTRFTYDVFYIIPSTLWLMMNLKKDANISSCLESKNDGITTPFHYEKLFLWKLHYPSIKCLMQLVCNYATFFPCKCEAFKTKMPLKNSQVLWQLHINSKMDPYTILIHPIYMIVINLFSLCWQGA
jgi:hypothetical protein